MLLLCTEGGWYGAAQGDAEGGPGGRDGGLQRVRAAGPAGAEAAGRGASAPAAVISWSHLRQVRAQILDVRGVLPRVDPATREFGRHDEVNR